MKTPSLKKVEAVLGPARGWAGQCYAIAKQMVKRGLIKGTARYGHWLGPVAKGTAFSYRPIIQVSIAQFGEPLKLYDSSAKEKVPFTGRYRTTKKGIEFELGKSWIIKKRFECKRVRFKFVKGD